MYRCGVRKTLSNCFALYDRCAYVYTYNINIYILSVVVEVHFILYFFFFLFYIYLRFVRTYYSDCASACVKNIINNTTTSTTMTVGRHGRSSKIKEHERRATRPHDDPDDHISCTYV